MKPDQPLDDGRIAFYRHPWPVRIAHWITVLCLPILLMSGLQILNAHPWLYWGQASDFDAPFISFASGPGPAFPPWTTLPGWRDLATGRQWHFFFAWLFVLNGLVYGLYVLLSGRLGRVLLPTSQQLRSLRSSFVEHLKFHFPHGEAARRYNVLQKLSYLAVLFGLLPLMVLTGLTMSPGMNARLPVLLDLFGGRQSARTLHFLTACALVLFFVIHMIAVFAAGPLNELRSIVTGWFVIENEEGRREPP